MHTRRGCRGHFVPRLHTRKHTKPHARAHTHARARTNTHTHIPCCTYLAVHNVLYIPCCTFPICRWDDFLQPQASNRLSAAVPPPPVPPRSFDAFHLLPRPVSTNPNAYPNSVELRTQAAHLFPFPVALHLPSFRLCHFFVSRSSTFVPGLASRSVFWGGCSAVQPVRT